MEVSKSELEKMIDKAVEKRLEEEVKHWCFTCRWFMFRENGTRVCQCPDDLVVKAGICQNWRLEPRKERRVKRFA